MLSVSEAEVIWQYLRWHGQYRDVADLPIIKDPDFSDARQNEERWAILARDRGHVLRVRYPFISPPQPYRWTHEVATPDLLETALSNYGIGGRLLPINEIALKMVQDGILPPPFNDDNSLIVRENLNRLQSNENIDDYNAIILCRPTPGLPSTVYRVVEGSKRAIAIRVAQLQGIWSPEICCYLGEYP